MLVGSGNAFDTRGSNRASLQARPHLPRTSSRRKRATSSCRCRSTRRTTQYPYGPLRLLPTPTSRTRAASVSALQPPRLADPPGQGHSAVLDSTTGDKGHNPTVQPTSSPTTGPTWSNSRPPARAASSPSSQDIDADLPGYERHLGSTLKFILFSVCTTYANVRPRSRSAHSPPHQLHAASATLPSSWRVEVPGTRQIKNDVERRHGSRASPDSPLRVQRMGALGPGRNRMRLQPDSGLRAAEG